MGYSNEGCWRNVTVFVLFGSAAVRINGPRTRTSRAPSHKREHVRRRLGASAKRPSVIALLQRGFGRPRGNGNSSRELPAVDDHGSSSTVSYRTTPGIVSSAKGLDSGRRSYRVEPLRRPISDKLEFRLVPTSPERLQPLLLIFLFWCPARWPRRPESRPLAEPSITIPSLAVLGSFSETRVILSDGD